MRLAVGGILTASWVLCCGVNLPLATSVTTDVLPPPPAALPEVIVGDNAQAAPRLRPQRRRHLQGKSQSSLCVSKSEFANVCTRQLLLDSDSDLVVSQHEYALFIDRMPCFFNSEDGYHNLDSAAGQIGCPTSDFSDSSFPKTEETDVQSSSSFASLPIRLQLSFMRGVCSHIDDRDQDFTDCMSNLITQGYSHQTFGFDLKQDQKVAADLEAMCLETYDGAVAQGVLSACAHGVGGTMEVRVSYAIRTNGIDASSLMSGADPPNQLRQGLLEGTLGTVRDTLETTDGNRDGKRTLRVRRLLKRQSEKRHALQEIETQAIENAAQNLSAEEEDLFRSVSRHRQQPRERQRKRRRQQPQEQPSIQQTQESKRDLPSMKRPGRSARQVKKRLLATFDEQEPVSITAAIDDRCWFPPPQTSDTRCLLVRSTITLQVDENNDVDQDIAALRKLVIEGLREKGIQLPDNTEGFLV